MKHGKLYLSFQTKIRIGPGDKSIGNVMSLEVIVRFEYYTKN